MLNVAVKAARAGAIINRAALDVESVRIAAKRTNDFVTEVDKAAKKTSSSRPCWVPIPTGIWAEESVAEERVQDASTWIIDPLDGTTNFIHGRSLRQASR